jgi:hypothetical protein
MEKGSKAGKIGFERRDRLASRAVPKDVFQQVARH